MARRSLVRQLLDQCLSITLMQKTINMKPYAATNVLENAALRQQLAIDHRRRRRLRLLIGAFQNSRDRLLWSAVRLERNVRMCNMRCN